MPASLHRERILEAATAYIDRFSPDALTMRRLGVHLGVEAMALHRHVAGKEDLLAGGSTSSPTTTWKLRASAGEASS